MALDFIICEAIHLHKLPDLLRSSSCKTIEQKSNQLCNKITIINYASTKKQATIQWKHKQWNVKNPDKKHALIKPMSTNKYMNKTIEQPWAPPRCCRALTNRRCNSGDQHLLCFREVCCGDTDFTLDWPTVGDEDVDLIGLGFELKTEELIISFEFLISEVPSDRAGSPGCSSFLSFPNIITGKLEHPFKGANVLLLPRNNKSSNSLLASSFLCSRNKKHKRIRNHK